jgi:hypothetical protein
MADISEYMTWCFEVEFAGKGTQRDWFETRPEAERAYSSWMENGKEPDETLRVLHLVKQSPETPKELTVIEIAAGMGLKLRQIATGLYSMQDAWCSVTISSNLGKDGTWTVRRRSSRRWKTLYKGTVLKTALQKAKDYGSY